MRSNRNETDVLRNNYKHKEKFAITLQFPTIKKKISKSTDKNILGDSK
jgi:hypothetical protein